MQSQFSIQLGLQALHSLLDAFEPKLVRQHPRLQTIKDFQSNHTAVIDADNPFALEVSLNGHSDLLLPHVAVNEQILHGTTGFAVKQLERGAHVFDVDGGAEKQMRVVFVVLAFVFFNIRMTLVLLELHLAFS